MQTTDAGLLFQTTSSLTAAANHQLKVAATSRTGSPIHLSGKVLDLEIRGHKAWTAESGWLARCLDLTSGETVRLYKGHQGPVTSIALADIQPNDGSPSWVALFTGSWDKSIRVWNAESGEMLHVLEGHTDFVKSITILPSPKPLLLSTSSDRTIRLWDLTPLSSRATPGCVQMIREQHTRPVECAAWRLDIEAEDAFPSVWTADSLGVIKRWMLQKGSLAFVADVPGHVTSVARIVASDDGLWSVSADKTAIFHPFNGSKSSVLPHTASVKAILPLLGADAGRDIVLSGSEDEEIRVWDVSGLPNSPAKLVSIVPGHCGEISAIKHCKGIKAVDGLSPWVVVSGSLDGSLRRWTLQDLLQPLPLDFVSARETDFSSITAEEELELAELLSDDEDA